ncbi:MAG: acyl carrier protein [Acidimicrobiia bacterium]|nr:acyl carrier protein [Acidimicrobiia bacterium]
MTTPHVSAHAAIPDAQTVDDSFGDRLTEHISMHVALDGNVTIERETNLLLTGLVDSLGVMMIIEWIESDLGISINAGDVVLENFLTVEAMLDFVGTQ